MSIEEIQDKVRNGEYRYSDHTVKQMIRRSIERYEVEDAIMRGEIIEEYSDDKYSPSCLIEFTCPCFSTAKGSDYHNL